MLKRKLLPSIAVLAIIGCNDRGPLRDPEVTLELSWVGFGCRCPDWCQWRTSHDPEPCLFVEPADPSLELPDSVWGQAEPGPRVRFTGRFYEKPGRPNEYYTEGVTEGPVLQYTAYEILR